MGGARLPGRGRVLEAARRGRLFGLLSGPLFGEPWQGVVLAVALTLLVAAAPAIRRRLGRGGRGGGARL
uniref:Integral membrane protein n=1 Tax=Streptomyces auratus AGR0001 TaxID=1160718 RepID=J2A335_9ACTN